ncbi:MAG: cohesin domain-containing protein [Euryarchaeota archaeon]|nr:cohesin domain-containing protein [Euryarchaeota archaeon]
MEAIGEVSRGGCMLSKVGTVVFLLLVAIAFVSLAVAPVMAQEDVVTVTVNAPELVVEKGTFEVTIDLDSITNFTTGLFDLSFDHKVVEVKDVEDGNIDGTTIPVDEWKFMGRDTITVFLNLPGDTVVSGSGYLAKIKFEVEGDEGYEGVLKISNEFLGGIADGPKEILADWIDATIKVGKEEGEEEQPPPSITAWEPTGEAVSSTEGESITFEISVDQEVDISWQINGTEVQTDEGVTKAEFTRSAVAGTWNVSAIATSTETGLSSMHTWIWSVTAESTEASEGTSTPTPTLAPGVTPTPTPKATPTPGQTVKATPTVKPTSTPKSKETTPTPTSKTPGFEAIFAIAAMSAIAYILVRWR